MEKSKLGISVGLFAAILFFIGATGSGVLIISLATLYILMIESSEWLRKTALKALIFAVFFAILMLVLNLLINGANNFFNFINFITNYGASKVFSVFSQLMSLLMAAARIIEVLLFVVFGLNAYRQKDIKIKWIDDIIARHF